jgi:hypothetical protein
MNKDKLRERLNKLAKYWADYPTEERKFKREIKSLIASQVQEATKVIYDVNRLGTYIFIGDEENMKNMDDLYWSYVIEFMSENDPWSASHDKTFVERQKRNMQYANFGGVGETKALARADQRAKERLSQLKEKK